MHDFSPFYSPFAPGLMTALIPFFLAAALWTVILKGYSLWYAGRAGQKWWFIALLVINTLGVLEIVYLIWFRPKTDSHVAPPAPAHASSAPVQ